MALTNLPREFILYLSNACFEFTRTLEPRRLPRYKTSSQGHLTSTERKSRTQMPLTSVWSRWKIWVSTQKSYQHLSFKMVSFTKKDFFKECNRRADHVLILYSATERSTEISHARTSFKWIFLQDGKESYKWMNFYEWQQFIQWQQFLRLNHKGKQNIHTI